MWTGDQWGICLSGLSLLTPTTLSIAIFLVYIIKNREVLSQRILNVLYTKLAIVNLTLGIILFVEMMWHQSGVILGDGLKMFMQLRIFIAFTTLFIFLELSICSLLRLFSSQLYMWASLNIPHTAYNILQAFIIVFIQYLCISNSGIENAQNVTEHKQILESAIMPVMGPMMGLVFCLQMVVLLR